MLWLLWLPLLAAAADATSHGFHRTIGYASSGNSNSLAANLASRHKLVRRERRSPELGGSDTVEEATTMLFDTGDVEVAAGLQESDDRFLRLLHTPPIAQFDAQMTLLHRNSLQQKLEPRGNVKLLIGVVTMGYEQDYRAVHRKTWMSRPGVCRVDLSNSTALHSSSEGCRFFVAFVVGHRAEHEGMVLAENSQHHDIVQPFFPDNSTVADPLSREENFNRAGGQKQKTHLWLRFVASHFKWATHIAKMDMDVWPHADLVLADLREPAHSSWASPMVKPAGWSERSGGVYYGASCGGLRGMKQGSFYALSRSLVDCMFRDGRLAWSICQTDCPSGGVSGEDLMVFEWVRLVTKSGSSNGTCPDPWWIGPAACSGDRWAPAER